MNVGGAEKNTKPKQKSRGFQKTKVMVQYGDSTQVTDKLPAEGPNQKNWAKPGT